MSRAAGLRVRAVARPRLLLAGAVLGVVLLGSLAAWAVTARLTDRGETLLEAGPAVATAVSFAGEVTTADADERAQAIGRWVVPHRVPEFVAAFDEPYPTSSSAVDGVSATPRAYRIVERSPLVALVLVWSEVSSGGERSWQVSAFGVILEPEGWRVFSYDGTAHDVEPGDPRLDGFTRLTDATMPRPPGAAEPS